jgi:hypothetical protein
MTKLNERGFACYDLNTANTVTVTATNNNSTPLSALLATTKVVRVSCSAHPAHVAMTGTATANDLYMPAETTEYFVVRATALTPAFINAGAGNNAKVNLTEFDA